MAVQKWDSHLGMSCRWSWGGNQLGKDTCGFLVCSYIHAGRNPSPRTRWYLAHITKRKQCIIKMVSETQPVFHPFQIHEQDNPHPRNTSQPTATIIIQNCSTNNRQTVTWYWSWWYWQMLMNFSVAPVWSFSQSLLSQLLLVYVCVLVAVWEFCDELWLAVSCMKKVIWNDDNVGEREMNSPLKSSNRTV